MKIKTIKKAIAMFSLVAVSVCSFGLNVSVAGNTSDTATTSLNALSGSTSDIFIKGKWEMKGKCFDVSYDDTTTPPTPIYTYNQCAGVSAIDTDGTVVYGEGLDDEMGVDGAQFFPPVEGWGHNMDYTVCEIVHGPSGSIDDIDNVYAEIYYPGDRPMHELTSVAYDGNGDSYNPYGADIDDPQTGCGDLIEQNILHPLSQADGINLVCTELLGKNSGLVEWGNFNPGTNWAELCSTDALSPGELIKGRAAVYCSDKSLTWEHPAGVYKVDAFAYDGSEISNILTNYFTYIEALGFEIDFSAVDYGDVSLNSHQRIYGDKIFNTSANGNSTTPTVRNIGNVRLNMKIAQDDMGLGKKDTCPDDWRVHYDARVGDLDADWRYYDPFKFTGEIGDPEIGDPENNDYGEYTQLVEILDLSEIEEMDFSILVEEKWPENLDGYGGGMWLGADRADFDYIKCQG